MLRLRWPMLVVLLLFSLTIFDYVLFWTGNLRSFPYLHPLVAEFYFAYGPVFWVWHQKISSSKPSLGGTIAHFVPVFVFLLTTLPLEFGWVEPFNDYDFPVKGIDLVYAVFLKWQPWLVILHMLIYAAVLFRFQFVFRGFPILFRWVGWLNGFFMGFALAFLSYYVLVHLRWLRIEWDYLICTSMCLFILGIQVIAYLFPQILNGQIPKLVESNSSKYINSPVSGTLGKTLAVELEQKVKQTTIWRKNDVGLDDLAELIGQPRQYVSQILNEQFGQNFYEYINGLRIEEARELLLQPQHRKSPVQDIAWATGFNNKVSFYRSFKNRFGVTPTEFREKHGAF